MTNLLAKLTFYNFFESSKKFKDLFTFIVFIVLFSIGMVPYHEINQPLKKRNHFG